MRLPKIINKKPRNKNANSGNISLTHAEYNGIEVGDMIVIHHYNNSRVIIVTCDMICKARIMNNYILFPIDI